MRQYSIDRVEATWASLDLKQGIAQGTSIQEGRNAPKWTQKPTGNGKVVRVYNPDKSGQLTILVDQEAKLHQQLLAIAITDEASRNQVFPFMVRDTSTGEVIVFSNAYIMTEPDEARGTESQVFPWVFMYERRDSFPNASDQNIVGQ